MNDFSLLPSKDVLTPLILGFSLILFVIIRYTNSSFFYETINHVYPILKIKKGTQTTNNKSNTFFSLLFFLLFFAALNQLNQPAYLNLLISLVVTGYLFSIWVLVNQFILKSSDLNLFFNKKIKTIHFISLVLFIVLVFNEYLFSNKLFLLSAIALFALFSIYKSIDLLIGRLSLFHIILYICTLEIIPLLLIIKWNSKL